MKLWLRSTQAFGVILFPGILFLGVYDNGTPEQPKNPINLESLQKTLSERISDAWPPIYFLSRILRQDGQQFLAVLVPGSSLRPHFAGQSFIRVGPETRKASESQFAELVAQRQSKSFEILRWKGQDITIERTYAGRTGKYPFAANVIEYNAFYVTLRKDQDRMSLSLTNLDISYDDKERRLKLQVHEQGA